MYILSVPPYRNVVIPTRIYVGDSSSLVGQSGRAKKPKPGRRPEKKKGVNVGKVHVAHMAALRLKLNGTIMHKGNAFGIRHDAFQSALGAFAAHCF